MTGEIIIKDSISVVWQTQNIYHVTALVMGANDNRANAKSITVLWNSNTSSSVAKDLLITNYQATLNPPELSIVTQLQTDIGTDIPIPNDISIPYIQLVRVVT